MRRVQGGGLARDALDHIRRIARRLRLANYLSGTRANRFIIVTAFLFVLFSGIFLVYGGAYRSGIDVARAVDTHTSGGTSSVSISGVGISTAVLAFGLIFALIIYFTKLTESIPYEYGYAVLMVWVVASAYTRTDCLCCAVDPAAAAHRSTFILLADNASRKAGTCDVQPVLGVPIIAIVLNLIYVVGVIALYSAHLHDMRFSTIHNTMRLQVYAGAAPLTPAAVTILKRLDRKKPGRSTAAAMASEDPEYGVSAEVLAEERGQMGIALPFVRTTIALVVFAMALIPLQCNNAQLVSYLEYGLRVVLFLCLFLLRLAHDYARKFVLRSKIRSLAIVNANAALYGPLQTDPSPAEPLAGPSEVYGTRDTKARLERARILGRAFDTLSPPPDRTDIGITSQFRIELFNRYMEQRVLIDIVTAALLASVCLVLCRWFLVLVAAQLGYEIYLQYDMQFKRGLLVNALYSTAFDGPSLDDDDEDKTFFTSLRTTRSAPPRAGTTATRKAANAAAGDPGSETENESDDDDSSDDSDSD